MKERQTRRVLAYVAAAAIVAACTLLSGLIHQWDFDVVNLVMIFLAGVAMTAARYGRGPALAAIALSVLSYDYFFVPPAFAFAKLDGGYVITLGVMTAIGLLISDLTSRLNSQLRASRVQERRSTQLFQMTRKLGQAVGLQPLLETARTQLAEVFEGAGVIYLRESNGTLALRCGAASDLAQDPFSATTALWAFEHRQLAGCGTDALPTASALFAPMVGAAQTIGALGVQPLQMDRFLDPDERRMLETCANLIALSIERDQSLVQAQDAQTQVQSEKLRNSLLTSISHDLRTPLATIEFEATGLLDEATQQTPVDRREVLETIVDQTRQLGRQVENLLDMGRFNSSEAQLAPQWEVFEDLLGVALSRLRRELAKHVVEIDVSADLPMLWVTADLLGQVLVNLLENAARYTPPGSAIRISARKQRERAEIAIADNGPGLPLGSEDAVFEKFVRGSTKVADGRRGLGLGLAICQSIVRAHQGEITARNRPQGGAEFVISLPCPPESPQITLDDADIPAGELRVSSPPRQS